jgi:hypothetical protein
MHLFSEAALAAYDAVYGAPDYAKSAEIRSSDVAGLPASSFADAKRALPVHTKAAVWLSALEHYYAGGEPKANIDASLLKTAKFFGIENDVLAVKAAGVERRNTVRSCRTPDD